MKQTDRIFITGINGNKIEVIDLKAAIEQATNCVNLHEETKAAKGSNPDTFYFADAHKEWDHILLELQKLKP